MKHYVRNAALVAAAVLSCNKSYECTPNPEEYLVHELSHRRIVMLGDFYHEIALPYQTAVKFLATWLDMVERGESDECHLALFLEEDSQIAGFVREYVISNNLQPFLDFVLPSTSLERLEFYADLRKISLRIDSMNSRAPQSKILSLNIEGPEAFNILDPGMLDLSRDAAQDFYVKKRDSLAAANIVACLNDHPEQKGLIFYGSGHLIKRPDYKSAGGSEPSEKGKGYYLAYYLKGEFGDRLVFSVNQYPATRLAGMGGAVPSEDVIVSSDKAPWKSAPAIDGNLNCDNFDAFILRKGAYCASHPLCEVVSRRVLQSSIKRVEKLYAHRTGQFGGRLYEEAFNAIEFLTGVDSTAIDDSGRWKKAVTMSGVQSANSSRFRKQLQRYYCDNINTPETLRHLVELGFPSDFQSARRFTDEDWSSVLDRAMPRFLYLNAIGVYWIGFPDEKEVAKRYLVEFSGQNFLDPGSYLKWWRKQYCHANY